MRKCTETSGDAGWRCEFSSWRVEGLGCPTLLRSKGWVLAFQVDRLTHDPQLMRLSIYALFFILLLSASVAAQSHDAGPPKNEFAVLLGGSYFSSNILAFSEGRKLVITELRYARLLTAHRRFSLKMTMDIVPAAILIEPKNVELTSRIIPGSPWRSVYGLGLTPAGLQMNFRPRKRVQPFFESSFGFLYFDRRVISPAASRFNFTVDLGPGVQLFTSPRQAVTLGYRYHHLSNANISDRNPGADSNIFYVGYSFFWRHFR
jgi:Lipid A 3-O-deacylase (PagL)